MAMHRQANESTSGTSWYIEANIRSRLMHWLRDHGYFPATDATTPPADALVVRSVYGATSRITVRGFPEGDEGDARQWFASALLDLAQCRASGADVGLALALPAGFPAYATLAANITWLRDAMPFSIYWIAESGAVQAE